MSKDLTTNINASQDKKLDQIITSIEGLYRIVTVVEALDIRLQAVEDGLRGLDIRLQAVEARLHDLDTRLQTVESGLRSLETKVEERLKDTRPMWEAVQGQLTELRSEFKTDLGQLRLEFKTDLEKLQSETEKGFRRLGHKIGLHNQTVEDLHADLRDQEERLDKLEEVGS